VHEKAIMDPVDILV